MHGQRILTPMLHSHSIASDRLSHSVAWVWAACLKGHAAAAHSAHLIMAARMAVPMVVAAVHSVCFAACSDSVVRTTVRATVTTMIVMVVTPITVVRDTDTRITRDTTAATTVDRMDTDHMDRHHRSDRMALRSVVHSDIMVDHMGIMAIMVAHMVIMAHMATMVITASVVAAAGVASAHRPPMLPMRPFQASRLMATPLLSAHHR